MMYAPFILLASIIWLSLPASAQQEDEQLNNTYLPILLNAAEGDDFWVAVHGAEYLIDLGYTEQAQKVCSEYLVTHESTPQLRIGLWRVQYQLELQTAAKQVLLNKIISAYETTEGPDRIHAAETLAKLRYCFHQLNAQMVTNDLSRNDMLGTFVKWGNSIACHPNLADDHDSLMALLDATPEERRLAAYGLTFLSTPAPGQWQRLAETALGEKDKEVRPYLLGAAYQLYNVQLNPSSTLFDCVKSQLFSLADSDLKAAGMELCRALANRPDTQGKKILKRFINKSRIHMDIRAAAAYALLKHPPHE